jgi:hypothetical protein
MTTGADASRKPRGSRLLLQGREAGAWAAEALDLPLGFDGIFQLVRNGSYRVFGRERTGLSLALADLPGSLGAYWQVAGNFIVVNQPMLESVRRRYGPGRDLNSFVFVILAHEYLHALGFLDESSARRATARLAREALGPDHPATRLAEGDLWRIYPEFSTIPPGDGRRIRPVRNFDSSSTSTYIR